MLHAVCHIFTANQTEQWVESSQSYSLLYLLIFQPNTNHPLEPWLIITMQSLGWIRKFPIWLIHALDVLYTINTEQILNLVWSIQPLYSCLYSLPNNKYSPNSNPESRCGLIRFIWFINTSQQVAKPQNYNLLHYSKCVRVPPPLLQQCHDMTHWALPVKHKHTTGECKEVSGMLRVSIHLRGVWVW